VRNDSGVSHKNGENCDRIPPNGANNFFSREGWWHYNVAFQQWISTIFETRDMNQCPGGDQYENFNFLHRDVLQAQKRNFGGLRVGCLYSVNRSNATI